MRIHTDKLSALDIYAAANFDVGVTVVDLSEHGSRTRARAINFYLNGTGRSGGQWGNYRGTGQAATWDEWGLVIGHLYARDPAAHFGRYSYRSADDFHDKTGYRFVPGFITPDMQHRRHKWQPTGDYSAYCECGAYQRWPNSVPGPIEPSAAAAA